MLHRYGWDLFLLSIDEGINGYRGDSLETVKRNEQQVSFVTACGSKHLSMPTTVMFGTLPSEMRRAEGRADGCGG